MIRKGDKLKSGSRSWHKRQAIRTHNGLRGKGRMAQLFLEAVIDSHSTTFLAKGLAAGMRGDMKRLLDYLKERDDTKVNEYLNAVAPERKPQ